MLKEEARGSRAISGLHWLRARLHFGRSEPGMCGPPSRARHSRAENVSALPAVSIRAGDEAATSGRAHLLSGRSRTKRTSSNLSRFSAAHCLHQPRRDAPSAAAECVRREQLHRDSASSASLHKDHGSAAHPALREKPARCSFCRCEKRYHADGDVQRTTTTRLMMSKDEMEGRETNREMEEGNKSRKLRCMARPRPPSLTKVPRLNMPPRVGLALHSVPTLVTACLVCTKHHTTCVCTTSLRTPR